MIIGLNVVTDGAQSIGFTATAARAMRPPAIRFVVMQPEDIEDWILSARLARLRVWWCLPIETMNAVSAEHALAHILQAPDVTVGIEIGDRPAARRDAHPIWFCDRAYQLARLLPGAADGEPVPGPRLPVVLGTGFDASTVAAWHWTEDVLDRMEAMPYQMRAFTGLGVAGTCAGRPLRWRAFRSLAARLRASQWRLVFTRFGWPLGSPLSRWQACKANWQEVFGDRPMAPGWTTTVDRHIRNRWISDGIGDAEHLIQASHVFLDPERPTFGGQRWPLYDAPFGRPDPFWLALMHRDLDGRPVMPPNRRIVEGSLR